MAKCKKCGKELVKGEIVPFGPKNFICLECAEELESAPLLCPVCKEKTPPELGVGMLMVPVTATPEERLEAVNVAVNVCPKCHSLYLDEFQYGIVQGLRRV